MLQELKKKGITKVGREKISELESKEAAELDYESILSEYQGMQRRERENFEISKKKKMNDIEIWTRARKEEERKAMELYCKEHGQEEVQ